MIIVEILYGIFLIFLGSGILKYRKIIKSWTGNFYWAEKYIGSGGTYLVIILIGMLLIFFGVTYPFGGKELFISN
ncbi:hypothetical protein A9Q91_03120 [Candidatus Gracilibacteria bacterium 28_42_T64]|nr:hypothetical protein A9Q91_03120 [Candidatus Gracilibacteria bacterium 28_42_T64]